MNFHLDAGNVGVNTGAFYWHKTFTPIMTLTYDGKLGIGITLPEHELHVSGGSTITGASYFGSTLGVGGDLTVGGSLNSDVTGDLTGDVTGFLIGNVNAASGISTFTKIKTGGSLGVGLEAETFSFEVNPNEEDRFVINGNGNVGIGTTVLYDLVGLAVKTQGAFSQISVGSTDISGSVDFSKAGGELQNEAANITKRFMVPPKVTTAERGNLTGLVAGAMVYDTTLNKLVLYQGASWVGIGTTTL
tara:strand:- start:1842 stop:2579 length:738 start_codon:yes stop_codon:yes gene_type:complete